jgi:hypothetical protein
MHENFPEIFHRNNTQREALKYEEIHKTFEINQQYNVYNTSR